MGEPARLAPGAAGTQANRLGTPPDDAPSGEPPGTEFTLADRAGVVARQQSLLDAGRVGFYTSHRCVLHLGRKGPPRSPNLCGGPLRVCCDTRSHGTSGLTDWRAGM